MKKISTIKILDEINVAVLGLSPDDMKYIYDRFGIFDKDYFFKRQFKLGTWDGKIRLVSKTGLTSIHFIEEIIPEIVSLGYQLKLIDNRNPVEWNIPHVDAETFKKYDVILGDHQVESINALIDNKGGISIAATGAGKSYIIGGMVNLLHSYMKLRCIVIVPSIDLVNQTAKEIQIFENDVGTYSGAEKQLNRIHLVSTWQSLQNNPQIISRYNAVIVDEAHGTKSNVLKNMLLTYAKKSIFFAGVTGTLPKHEAEVAQIRYVLGNPIHMIEGRELMDKGWLARLKMFRLILKEDFSQIWEKFKELHPEDVGKLTLKTFKNTYFPDYKSEKTFLQNKKERQEVLAKLIEETTKVKGNSFVLVNGVPFGKKLSKLIPNSVFIHGEDDTKLRKQIYDLYATNDDMVVIATFNLASTGLNIKRIFNLFLIDANKSFIQVIQSIGRGLRKAEDKDTVRVWDISSDLKYSKSHGLQRKKYYDEQSYPYQTISTEYDLELVDDLLLIEDALSIDIDNINETVVY